MKNSLYFDHIIHNQKHNILPQQLQVMHFETFPPHRYKRNQLLQYWEIATDAEEVWHTSHQDRNYEN